MDDSRTTTDDRKERMKWAIYPFSAHPVLFGNPSARPLIPKGRAVLAQLNLQRNDNNDDKNKLNRRKH